MQEDERRQRLAMRSGLERPPTFTVGWRDALFEHYRVVDEAPLRRLLPEGLELDRHDGAAWLSVVSFRMVHMRWRGLLLLGCHTYPQVNVRLYVRHGPTYGVFFLRNLVGDRLAAWGGRWLYGMPYVHSRVRRVGAAAPPHSEAGPQVVAVGGGAPLHGHEEAPDALLHFLLERYPLFSVRRGRLHVAAMRHAPWEVHALEAPERSHGLVAHLGLERAVVPHPYVQWSPGVETLMWPARVVESRP